MRGDPGRRGGGGRRLREIALELALEELDARGGELIQRLEVLLGRDARVGDEQDAMLDVVEGQHRVEEHERGFGLGLAEAFALACPDTIERRLEPGRRVVAEEADGAAGHARQVGHERRAVLRHHPANGVDERLVERPRLARPLDDRRASARPQDEERVLAEKPVARHALATLDALEQERVVGVLGHLEERRHRREQVGHELLVDRHERPALCELHELFV